MIAFYFYFLAIYFKMVAFLKGFDDIVFAVLSPDQLKISVALITGQGPPPTLLDDLLYKLAVIPLADIGLVDGIFGNFNENMVA